MNIFTRCVFLYSFIIVFVTCANDNNQSNNTDEGGGKDKPGKGGFDFSQLGDILNSLNGKGGKGGNANNNGGHFDMLNNLLNQAGSSGGGLENLMNMFNTASGKGGGSAAAGGGNANAGGGSANAGGGGANLNNFDMGKMMDMLKQFGGKGAGADGQKANPMESIGNLLNMMNAGGGKGGDGKGGNPLEHLTSLLGNGGRKGGNPMEHLTSLLGNLGGNKGADGKGGNPMEHLTSLLGNLGGNKGADGKGGNPLEHLTSLLGNSGGKGGNPMEHLTSLLGNLGGNKGADGKGGNPMEHLTSLLGNLGGNNGADGKGGNPMEHLTSLLGNLGADGKGGGNNKLMGDIQSLLGNFLNAQNNQNAPFALDKSVMDGSASKEFIKLQHNQSERDLLRELQNLINKSKGMSGSGSSKELEEKNSKLKTFFSSLKGRYNPYSYERKILNDITSEEDIKNRYHIDDEFERHIYISANDTSVDYEEMSDEEKEKKTGMFADVNQLDDNDTVESGSISSHVIRKSKLENEKLLRGLIAGESDNLHECNCASSKAKNCVLSFINYNNLEYMLESLSVDVKSMVKRYREAGPHKGAAPGKGAASPHAKAESFLVPLPPLDAKADVRDTSKYVLRVPRVLFLSTKKAFSTSMDRYFFNLYDVMESQLKWNTYMWGYGFKYYPLFFTKNLHTLLHNYDKQIGREPFDIIFVHSSFVSNYYNHYFFLKSMPRMTTLIFINDGWDSNVKSAYLNLFPHIFFQNQVNIFEYNPLNSIDSGAEKRKLVNSLWNKVSSGDSTEVIANRHKKKGKKGKAGAGSSDGGGENSKREDEANGGRSPGDGAQKEDEHDEDENKTLWAFLPHGVNPCCLDQFEHLFDEKENDPSDKSNVVVSPTFYYDLARKKKKKKGSPKLELSYSLLDLYLPACTYKDSVPTFLSNTHRDIDVLYLCNTTSSNYNDFLIQKVMDYIYNKNVSNLKSRIRKYEFDLYYWKVWGMQTTHKLIKNKLKEYHQMLRRSKVCVISSKFAGMLNRMVVDALFSGCVVITDKSHNKDINKFIVTTRIPYEYYEIGDLVYNNENMNSLSKDMVEKINATLEEVNSGKKELLKQEAFKTVMNTYTYQGVILNWILPTLYFHHNKEKYELVNNYFVLPQYFEDVISKSLKTTSAKREKIIANIDLSLQEDLIMNNNEVATWCIIWVLIFAVIVFYLMRNSNLLGALFKQRKLHL
ncbi:hypothetical protein PVIIG_03732 [Plasmodium vivax India VII]|uniref:Golgi protein 2 n=1 Tax=Plasmodium vivax India VII TaxID=1077284 RepID=A0A0J9SC31_PLAVI|nr:hypothetical protein PVIIG_03732 [Plasmodium vivax India VII]CAI7720518.1 golgi protein 2, putative [Plasmodium vivax]